MIIVNKPGHGVNSSLHWTNLILFCVLLVQWRIIETTKTGGLIVYIEKEIFNI